MAEMNPVDPEIALLLEEWNRCTVEKDAPAATRLREDGYRVVMPSGEVLTREEEVAWIASTDTTVHAITTLGLETRRRGNRARVTATLVMTGEAMGKRFDHALHTTIEFRRTGSRWRARSARIAAPAADPPRARHRGAGGWLGRLLRRAGVPAPSFQALAYLSFRPGESFALPPAAAPATLAGELPIPPRELWLGYNYPAHGALHVEKMLEVAYESGLSFAPGDRILDLGCGAGRMIRHLRELAATCEIWGMDISAEHIFWCRENLCPPFHFATSTKVPHLPFEDRSFRFIYCGSLFTHIDDLADAWLLELHRILAPDGRLYVTVHDSHTLESLARTGYADSPLARRMRTEPVFQQAKDSFGMISIGRDHLSQVFYDTRYFTRMVSSMFEVMSVTPEAYFYQTAFLLRRKQR